MVTAKYKKLNLGSGTLITVLRPLIIYPFSLYIYEHKKMNSTAEWPLA